MEESITFQIIVEKGEKRGELNGRRALLLKQGTKKWGPPGKKARAAIQAIDSPQRLDNLGEAMLDAKAWADLLIR